MTNGAMFSEMRAPKGAENSASRRATAMVASARANSACGIANYSPREKSDCR